MIRRVEYGYRIVGSTSTRHRGWVDRSRAEAEMAQHAAYWPNERYELIEIVTTIQNAPVTDGCAPLVTESAGGQKP